VSCVSLKAPSILSTSNYINSLVTLFVTTNTTYYVLPRFLQFRLEIVHRGQSLFSLCTVLFCHKFDSVEIVNANSLLIQDEQNLQI